MDYLKRLKQVRSAMDEARIGSLFLPPSGDMEYLTGIRRQRPNATQSHMPGDWLYGTFVTPEEVLVVAPKMAAHFIEEQAAGKAFIDEVKILAEKRDYQSEAQQIIQHLGLTHEKIAISKKTMGMTLVNIQTLFPEIEFTQAGSILNPLRMIKDPEELGRMQEAARITDNVFGEVLKILKVGMTEEEIAREVDWQILQQGGEGTSFITGIMCEGSKALGFREDIGRSSKTPISSGQTLAFDFGIVYQGYVSDFGRTVYVGEPSPLARKLHHLVMESQQAAIQAMKAGKITASEVDGIARGHIEDAGYGEGFFHRLGHGIGIDVHEPPFLIASDDTPLQSGMTFTVEPSILVKGEAWVRVEDVVFVTEEGGEVLNKFHKEISVIH